MKPSLPTADLKDLPALIQHELHHPLDNLQGVIRLLGTGRFGQLSREGSQLLNTAMVNLDRLTRLAVAVEEQPTALRSVFSEEQIRLFQLKRDLPDAIAQKQIYLVYQPIVCTQTQTVVGFEALARWEHPTYGTISPTVFIPLAEESGLIHDMGKNLIEAACFQLRRWQRRLTGHQGLTMSVNLSALQLSQLDLADHIGRVLAATQIAPESLKLEITESTLIENSDVVGIVLQKLVDLGVQLYLDDFGTGYSSLSRLPSLPLDALKIDRSFVTNKNWAICEVILALSQKLGLNVIVEGIETAEEAVILKGIGFQYMQGYFFAHPLTVEAASALLIRPFSYAIPVQFPIPHAMPLA
ncbi:MAG: EAL domain-containing protein [Cyanobacteria bacterium]|nr:EAL domain-containing protein [Cyanobacteriota bacterium]MDA0867129.1 EAL domain-containing protein [Cyanobacteriota bacterium]